jgi:hypothetical protein
VNKLLKEFVRLALREATPLARVPNQLLSIDDEGKEDVEDEEVCEFSGVGAVAGYALPLGMNPDSAGRGKNRLQQKKK